jgi:hypothetical protein
MSSSDESISGGSASIFEIHDARREVAFSIDAGLSILLLIS